MASAIAYVSSRPALRLPELIRLEQGLREARERGEVRPQRVRFPEAVLRFANFVAQVAGFELLAIASRMLGGAMQMVSMIREQCNGT